MPQFSACAACNLPYARLANPPSPSSQDLRTRIQQMLNTGRFSQAEDLARRLLQSKSSDFESYFLLSAAMHFGGKSEQALPLVKQALALNPSHASSHNLLAQIQIRMRDFDSALANAKKAVQLDPRDSMAMNTLGAVHLMREESELALEPLKLSVQMNPRDPSAINNLGRVLADHAMVEEAIVMLDRALQPEPDNFVLLHNFTPLLNYPAGAPVRTRMAAAAAMARIYQQRAAGKTFNKVNDFTPTRKLRVGLMSYDLRTHSCAYFLRPLLKHFSREHFDLLGICCNGLQDDVTAELKSMCQGWLDVATLTPEDTARRIADAKVDILLELGGYTSGSRLEVCAFQPAPLQVEYLGYPGTTAMPQVPWRIVDTTTDLADQSELFTERLHRMDGCFLCYDPGANIPAPRAVTHDGPITFGSFSATTKICTATVELWAQVLKAVPDSTMLIKGWAMAGQVGPATIRKRFAAMGIDASRLRFAGRNKTSADHLRAYDQVDIALDTTPYVGTTTTCEAMMMGVPVITLAGTEHRSRVGASLLKASGVPELIAASPQEFVTIAAALATDRPRLNRYHATLRDTLLTSSLCDGPAFASRFDAALRTLWTWRCSQA